jgi:superfamily I DNA/RNA helicase
MLCLTVYEAKGLEFDDVILFNFFEDSKCGSQWKLMIDVEFSTKQVKKFKEFQFIDFDNLDINEDDLDSFKEDSEKDKEEEKVQTVMSKTDQEVEIETSLKLKRERGEVYRKFA